MSKIKTFRNKTLAAVVALSSSTLVLTDSEPAGAVPLLPEEFDEALEYIKDGLEPFQVANSVQNVLEFLNVIEGTDLSEQLGQVEARLVQEIQFWMDVQRDAATTAAFRKYHQILRNPTQTSLNQERITYLTASSSSNDAGDVYAELERLIWDNGDLERSIQLTTPFNTLAVMMAHAMVWYERYFPGEAPFSWWEFNTHYGLTYRANYSLVKASRTMCYPGYNPELGDIVMQHDTVFETSRLYRKRMNKNFAVGTNDCPSVIQRVVYYNPVTSRLSTHCALAETNVNINGQRFPVMNASAHAAARARARQIAQSDFRTADDVDAVREAMRNLRFLSGGDEGNGIEGDRDASEFFDPWVHELELCGANNPWAYVQRP